MLIQQTDSNKERFSRAYIKKHGIVAAAARFDAERAKFVPAMIMMLLDRAQHTQNKEKVANVMRRKKLNDIPHKKKNEPAALKEFRADIEVWRTYYNQAHVYVKIIAKRIGLLVKQIRQETMTAEEQQREEEKDEWIQCAQVCYK